jgi:hypothetical protein
LDFGVRQYDSHNLQPDHERKPGGKRHLQLEDAG